MENGTTAGTTMDMMNSSWLMQLELAFNALSIAPPVQLENCTALDHYWMIDVASRTQIERTASDAVHLERGVHSTSTIEL